MDGWFEADGLLCSFMKVSETYALTLEQLVVVLLENVPRMHKPYHFICLKAILHVLLSLQAKGNTFSKVLAGFGELCVVVTQAIALHLAQGHLAPVDVPSDQVEHPQQGAGRIGVLCC